MVIRRSMLLLLLVCAGGCEAGDPYPTHETDDSTDTGTDDGFDSADAHDSSTSDRGETSDTNDDDAQDPEDTGATDTGDDSSTDTGDDNTGDDSSTDTGDDDPTDTGDDGPTDTGDGGDDVPDYSDDVQPIWSARCGCHSGSSPSAGLNLQMGAGDIVGVATSQLPSMALVEPGSTSESYLWHKLVGDQATVGGTGQRMPRGGPYLGNAEMTTVEDWIDGGAPF